MGGGIFALRRPRPYSRHCGEGVAGCRPWPAFTTMRDAIARVSPTICSSLGGRRAIINGNGAKEDNDAARCVATSSKKRENRVETSAFGAQ